MSEKKAKNAFLRVFGHLSAKDRRNLGIVLSVSLVSAIIDVLGVGSIAPFLSVASNPANIEKNRWLHWAYSTLGFASTESFLVALGVGVIVFIVVTNAFRALSRFVVVRYTSMMRHKLSMKMMEGYLRQDYPFFLHRNSHEFVKNVNSEVQNTVQGTLMTFVDMVGFTLQLSIFFVFLMILNPLITITIALAVGSIYGLIYLALRSTVRRLGQNRFDLNRERGRVVSETFWGIKDTKILGVELSFLRQYEAPSLAMAKNESNAEVAGDVPKFALEAVAFATILVFVILVIVQTGSFQDAAVTVGLFAFASYRMIPSMQNLFKALTKMRYGAPASARVCEEFEYLEKNRPPSVFSPPPPRMPFQTNLRLEGISFTYPNTVRQVIRGITLEIGYHKTVGFAGATGSGKTTLIDIILGLLEPQEGRIVVDGTPLSKDNLRRWRSGIGYVPQSIYLSNASIAQNIAFGVPTEQIDMAQVEWAATQAQIHDFVTRDLPEGYLTEVGERGVRLSGGQRQRLGIARALYRRPEVLVFDEATSALDHETEAAVIEAVNALNGQLTVLMIAHRLTTLKGCDTIFLLEKGVVTDSGHFDDLATRHPQFAAGAS